MTADNLRQHIEERNDGTLYLKVGPKTFLKLRAQIEGGVYIRGENYFDYNSVRVICPDRGRLQKEEQKRALEHLGLVIRSYEWGIEE